MILWSWLTIILFVLLLGIRCLMCCCVVVSLKLCLSFFWNQVRCNSSIDFSRNLIFTDLSFFWNIESGIVIISGCVHLALILNVAVLICLRVVQPTAHLISFSLYNLITLFALSKEFLEHVLVDFLIKGSYNCSLIRWCLIPWVSTPTPRLLSFRQLFRFCWRLLSGDVLVDYLSRFRIFFGVIRAVWSGDEILGLRRLA